MFSEVVVANKNYAACAVSKPQGLDKTAIKVIRYDCPSFLLPLNLVNINNQLQLRYEILGGIRLSFMPMKMRKQAFIQMLNQMIMPFMDCADWFLDYRNFYLDRDYIMVEQTDYKVKYIYLPITTKKKNTEESILRFFGELVMEIDLEDDPAFLTSVMRCIMGKDASLHALANMLKEQTENKMSVTEVQPVIVQPERKEPETKKSETLKPETKVKSEISLSSGDKYGENNLAGAIGAGLFGDNNSNKKKSKKENKKEKKAEPKTEKDKKSKGFFGKLLEMDKKPKTDLDSQANKSQPSQQQSQSVPEEYPMRDISDVNFNTEIEDDEEYSSTDILRMRLESSTVENVPKLMELNMSKGYVIVGRYDKTGSMSADVNFDMSLTFIGRRHARFERVGEAFFVIDLESKNHTYLNNEELLPNRRYQLHAGDRVTFTKKYGITYRVC